MILSLASASVEGVMAESSYGDISWPESSGVLITVEMGKATPTSSAGCPTYDERTHADRKARL